MNEALLAAQAGTRYFPYFELLLALARKYAPDGHEQVRLTRVQDLLEFARRREETTYALSKRYERFIKEIADH